MNGRSYRGKQGTFLPRDHPVGVAFLDESGAISHSRFFTVGCLKLAEPAALLRPVQKLRDQRRYHSEFHFSKIRARDVPMYKDLIDVLAKHRDTFIFSAFVADRTKADVVARYGDPWTAYAKLSRQLLLGSLARDEVLMVLADNYSTPDEVTFEQDVRAEVNQFLKRLAILSVCRLHSHAADPLQIVDLLTSAVTFEFRQQAGEAKIGSHKAQVAEHLRLAFGIPTFIGGYRDASVNVALYRGKRGPK